MNMGLEHPYRRHHGHEVRNTNQHLDPHHMLINGRQRTFVPSSNDFSFFQVRFQVRLRRLQHTVGSNCGRHNNFVCLKPRFCAFAIARRQNTWEKQRKLAKKETIESNTCQKPSACDTHVSFRFVSDALPFSARHVGHAHEA